MSNVKVSDLDISLELKTVLLELQESGCDISDFRSGTAIEPMFIGLIDLLIKKGVISANKS